MIISRAEIANAARAYRTWEPSTITAEPPAWVRHLYETLPHQRAILVLGLRGQIVAGHYFVPAPQIVEKMLGRLLIDRIAV
ncbi:MAG: hypothetical protein M3126_09190 [Candidatus Eremiobacteraeota bacterium]|nr:hypothetical protein [Candidatus Eremiobacteraeota bacterium]